MVLLLVMAVSGSFRMRQLIKRAVLRGIRATGYDLTRLPLSEPADLSETHAPFVEGARHLANHFADGAEQTTLPTTVQSSAIVGSRKLIRCWRRSSPGPDTSAGVRSGFSRNFHRGKFVVE